MSKYSITQHSTIMEGRAVDTMSTMLASRRGQGSSQKGLGQQQGARVHRSWQRGQPTWQKGHTSRQGVPIGQVQSASKGVGVGVGSHPQTGASSLDASSQQTPVKSASKGADVSMLHVGRGEPRSVMYGASSPPPPQFGDELKLHLRDGVVTGQDQLPSLTS